MKAKEVMAMYDVGRETLCRWVSNGKIKVEKLPSGRYNYLVNEVKKKPSNNRKTLIYCRVSTSGQKENLDRQVERLKQYCITNGYGIGDIYKEVASALNYNRKLYRKMYEEVCAGTIERIVIEYKDRLLRIGFDDFQKLCEYHNTDLVVVDAIETTDKKKEIVDDMVSIIHQFSSRIYSSRKRKKIIDQIEAVDTDTVELKETQE